MFFANIGSENDKQKANTMKIPENPYVTARSSPFARTENAVVLKASTNDAGLRQRRSLADQPLAATRKTMFKPPRSSLSLGTAPTPIPADHARSQVCMQVVGHTV